MIHILLSQTNAVTLTCSKNELKLKFEIKKIKKKEKKRYQVLINISLAAEIGERIA